MERVVAYVDGFNLYYGLRARGWKRFYWLNIQRMMQHLLKPDQELIVTKYFTTIVKQPPDKHKRQAVFLEALQTLSDFELYYGHYLSNDVVCRKCGHVYRTYHEKITDVNIAVELLRDAFQDRFDVALLVSADGDLAGLLRTVRQLFGKKRFVVAFPPKRFSNALRDAASAHIRIGRNVVAKSVFPDQVVKPDGYILHRPAEWQ